jgi:hypothetical protein
MIRGGKPSFENASAPTSASAPGLGTDDGLQALALLKRFGWVTILNGHIHRAT